MINNEFMFDNDSMIKNDVMVTYDLIHRIHIVLINIYIYVVGHTA